MSFFGIDPNKRAGLWSSLAEDVKDYVSQEVWTKKKNFFKELNPFLTLGSFELLDGFVTNLISDSEGITELHIEIDGEEIVIDVSKSHIILATGSLENARQTLLLQRSSRSKSQETISTLPYLTHIFIQTPPIFRSPKKDNEMRLKQKNDIFFKNRLLVPQEISGPTCAIASLNPLAGVRSDPKEIGFFLSKSFNLKKKIFFRRVWGRRKQILESLLNLVTNRYENLTLVIQAEIKASKDSFVTLSTDGNEKKEAILLIHSNLRQDQLSQIIDTISWSATYFYNKGYSYDPEKLTQYIKEISEKPFPVHPHTHHLGTTPIGNVNGFTDDMGSSTMYNNLSYAGASLFCTASHANPTFTAVLLSLRLGKHLAEKYGLLSDAV